MPTSIGHALAGAAAAWGADLVPGRRAWRTAPPTASWYRRAGNGLTLVCVVLAAVPDADLLFHIHRTFSHSIGAVMLVGVLAAAIAALTNRPVLRIASMCAAAYGTHLLLDWLAVDLMPPYGIQVFWPFSDTWYMSRWIIFRQIERSRLLSESTMRLNVLAVAQELAVLAPILIVIWLIRVKALTRLAAQMSRGDHPAE
jgi:membrane-bound metal-dependent hydrolase YbcI (DUF457 family)